MHGHDHDARRSAFTLVEILVVITIIAMLAVLVAKSVANAMWHAKQVAIKTEIDQLDAALKSFKDKYGSYPPCNLAINYGSGSAATAPSAASPNTVAGNAQINLRQFLVRAFPKYRGAT